MGSQQVCTFRLGGLYLGVDVAEVQEVIRQQEMTLVPLASPVIRGLINLRGQIVTALDLRRRFGLAPREAGRAGINVVVRAPEGVVSLLVDEIDDVVDVRDVAAEKPPATMVGPSRVLIRNVFKLERELLLELDTARVLAPIEGS